jgi:DNA polymerase I
VRLYNGARLLGSGPCLDNVARIDDAAVPMTLAMMKRGLKVDLSKFEEMSTTLQHDMDRITADVHTLTGYHVNIDSGDQVSDLLFKKLGLKQARPKLTKSGDRESVEDEVLTAIQHDHEVVPKILEYKEYSKLKGTYVDPMPKLAVRVRLGEWRLFPKLGMTRIPSGRYNCKAPNLLAMPTRTKRGSEIRKAFITDEGWVYVSIDESQIEVRVGAHVSEDENLIRIYWEQEDVYSDFATVAFALPDHRYRDAAGKWHYPGIDKMEHRYPAKTCFLASIYDVSPPGLLEQMPIMCANCKKPTSADNPTIPIHDCGHFESLWTEKKCEGLLTSMYTRYPGILRDRRRHHQRARKHSMVWDMWGRFVHVGAVHSVHSWVTSAALREAGNLPYQGGACGTLKLTMGAVQDDLKATKMLGDVVWPLLPIHDELLFECRADVATDLIECVQTRFEHCVQLKVPIKAGGAIAPTWGDIEK